MFCLIGFVIRYTVDNNEVPVLAGAISPRGPVRIVDCVPFRFLALVVSCRLAALTCGEACFAVSAGGGGGGGGGGGAGGGEGDDIKHIAN